MTYTLSRSGRDPKLLILIATDTTQQSSVNEMAGRNPYTRLMPIV